MHHAWMYWQPNWSVQNRWAGRWGEEEGTLTVRVRVCSRKWLQRFFFLQKKECCQYSKSKNKMSYCILECCYEPFQSAVMTVTYKNNKVNLGLQCGVQLVKVSHWASIWIATWMERCYLIFETLYWLLTANRIHKHCFVSVPISTSMGLCKKHFSNSTFISVGHILETRKK